MPKTLSDLSPLERRMIEAGALQDGYTIEDWIAQKLIPGECLGVRARALAGHVETLAEAHVQAEELTARAAEEERARLALEAEETQAWAEYEAAE